MEVDYRYIFSDFADRGADVRVIDHTKNGRSFNLFAQVNDTQFRLTKTGALQPILADLVDLLTAVFTSDWLLPRSLDQKRHICVELPLRNPTLFQKHSEALQVLLLWYTNDLWTFNFLQRNLRMRKAEEQFKFPFPSTQTKEIALWSGGLDSYAGLCYQITKDSSPEYTLIGSGSNKTIRGTQKKIARQAISTYCQQKRINLFQIPFDFRYPKGGSRPRQNKTFRARGFVFKLCGAISALLEGQTTLYIYENGYGAFNLPFTQSDIGLAHTRSVHPISLIKMASFVSAILEKPFYYKNPFLFLTKAEMCADSGCNPNIAYATSTCDAKHRKSGSQQCGQCSSCLLRRLALQLAFNEDKTSYVNGSSIVEPLKHFQAMDIQAKRIESIFAQPSPWLGWLQLYPEFREWENDLAEQLQMTIPEFQNATLDMFHRHTDQWMQIRTLLEPALYTKKLEERQ